MSDQTQYRENMADEDQLYEARNRTFPFLIYDIDKGLLVYIWGYWLHQ